MRAEKEGGGGGGGIVFRITLCTSLDTCCAWGIGNPFEVSDAQSDCMYYGLKYPQSHQEYMKTRLCSADGLLSRRNSVITVKAEIFGGVIFSVFSKIGGSSEGNFR